jgi:DNA-binding transcriptional LysR family regulator
MAALPNGHRLARRAVVAVSDLADEPFVELGQRESLGYREMTRAVCAAAGFVPRVVQEVDAIDAIVACVAAGLGVGLVHGENDVPVEGVAYRPIEPPGPQVDTVAIWRADNDNPLIPLFLDCLRTAATTLHGPLLAAPKRRQGHTAGAA